MKPRHSPAARAGACAIAARVNRTGFTLIELSIVVLIVGLMASVAIVSMRAPYQSARLEDTIARIEFFDRQLRRHASRTNRPLQLRIDVNQSLLEVRGAAGGKAMFSPLPVAGGARIDRVAVVPGRIERRSMTIPITRGGRSPTYAVRIQPADGAAQWLLFAGLTGQRTRVEDDDQIQQLARAATRSDAP